MRRSLVVAAATLAVSSLVGAPAVAGPTVEDELREALDRFVARDDGPPGALVVLQRGDRTAVLTAGVADVATDAALDAAQHFRAASVSKAFSGAAALSLVDQGVLSLDDTVRELVPKHAPRWGDVTLRELLGHTSGVPDFIQNPEAQAAVGASPGMAPEPELLLDFVRDDPLDFEPGSRYRYSNSDNILAALMIESASGRPYDEVLRTEVYEPLGLEQTSLPVDAGMPTPFAHGYDVEEDPPEDVSELLAGGWAWASGGIVTTPADLGTFVRGYVGGELFGDDIVDEQRDVRPGGASEPRGPGRNAAGLALFRYRTRCGTVWGHTGNTFGYTQLVASSADGERSVVVSITRQVGGERGRLLAALRALEVRAVCAALTED